ncbi:MAG: glycerate kinase type-2 family protein [Rhodospirillaceae bacterium]
MVRALRNAVDPADFLGDLFSAAISAVLPGPSLISALPKAPRGRTIVLGAGKASGAMALTVEENWLGGLEGLVIVPDGYGRPCRSIDIVEASHPVPDRRGMAAAQRIMSMARAAGADDLVLCLISGGASSLMAAPAPGIELAEKRHITQALLRSGAAIDEINCVRKHLSAIKGGRLAALAAPAPVVTLIVSDVVGDDPAVIASGPTVADPTTCADAAAVLVRYGISVPAHIVASLAWGELETPKALPQGALHVIARPRDALAAAAAHAAACGFAVHDLGDARAGEARDEAHAQASLVRAVLAGQGPVTPPCVILSGGELVVTIRGKGRGGPNTEFALAFAAGCEDLDNVWLLAADTDGQDGASGAAGALVRPGMIRHARSNGWNLEKALADNDSASFFGACNALVTPGPTFTNVNDFRAIVILGN